MASALKKRLWFLLKLAVSAGIIYLIFRKIWQRQDANTLLDHLSELRVGWVVASALALCTAITCSLVRWQRLLVGQGIHAPWKHLFTTFMIGRFFGAVTPGGLGLAGYRIYDIVKYTGKNARAVASIGIEMVLGNLAVGIVAFVSAFFGMRYIGLKGIALMAAVFGSLILVAFTVLWKPQLVRMLAQRLPYAITQRVQSMVDAVCAYEGKSGLLGQSTLLAMGTHAFNGFIYVFAAKALGVELPWTELFFVSILQNVTAHVPVSINGVGLREAAALGLYTIVGVAPEQAVLIPIVGFSVEMLISSLGGLLLLARKADYRPEIRVDDAEREELTRAQIERVPESEWPRIGRGAVIGLGAGLLAGLLIGLGEAWAIAHASGGKAEPDLWFFGVTSYALGCGVGGLLAGTVLAYSGRLMQRARVAEPTAFAQLAGSIAGLFALIIGAFRIQRDVYQEELVWKSADGALVLAGCLLAALAVYAVLFFGLRQLAARSPFKSLLQLRGSLGLTALVVAVAAVPWVGASEAKQAPQARSKVSAGAGNVLFIVVDTLRADHVPSYGYTAGKTPALDAFAKEAVRFEQAYANASWTRPSFASLLTGRYASSHGVMSKASGLPDAADTIAESFVGAGYRTGGVVTNYNVAPFFNFQQGFEDYRYLPPNFLFGASDSAAKLSLLQVLRRVDEKLRAMQNRSEPGSAYQDAAVVNREVQDFVTRNQGAPWFLFAAYMDPHDPYYEHPYNGVGYSRAAHVKPDPEEAPRLRALYDGEITFWDQHFGELIQSLKQQKLYDDLTIVVTADHGEEFMEHGGFWHGTTLYDEQLHVPLFVKLPRGERAGTTVSHWVESVDVMPTLLGLHKIPVPSAVQGVDLFRGKEQTFAEESHEGNVLSSLRTRDGESTVKLITANPGNPRGLAERELFRLEADPTELKNLSPSEPKLLERSEAELEAASEQAKTGALKAREVDLAMDKAAQERLKALGYANE
jgi:arylsulfatase A-like enzyme/uncharacterized membrane protein YbhN (UPF0104 family)